VGFFQKKAERLSPILQQPHTSTTSSVSVRPTHPPPLRFSPFLFDLLASRSLRGAGLQEKETLLFVLQ
jgi:hypothetical protein